jgi:hypothetical protein
LDLQAAGGSLADEDEEEDGESGDQGEEQTSEVRAEVERRLRALAGDDEDTDEEES